jgi:tetraacyldisaccharide 4'-kinase
VKAPDFWQRDGLVPALLAPASCLFALGGAFRRWRTRPVKSSVPIICIGNLVAGGAGKTPVVLSLAARLQASGRNPHILTRGYGGALVGPVRVDPASHDFRAVGDEPLLLAQAAPTWVSRDRPAGARAAVAAGADLILMDDGLQNPTLHQDFAAMVVDGGYGFGNGRVMPAGPLRESLASGIARVQLAIMIGADRTRATDAVRRLPVARAHLAAHDALAWRGRRVLAFAGIGRPAKFFETLEELGAIVVARHGFADHHPYTADEIDLLLTAASAAGAMAVTTAKDHVRVPPERRGSIASLAVDLVWDDAAALDAWLEAVP